MPEKRPNVIGDQNQNLNPKRTKKSSRNQKRRRLPDLETEYLKTLWRWKVLSYKVSHDISFPKISFWNCYRKLRRLVKEGLITEGAVNGIGLTVLHLTKKGFDQIKYDLGELKELRFSPQSITHDYWATAFQLAPFIHDRTGAVQFVTEQEHQTSHESLLPAWIPKARDHIPDGFTFIRNGSGGSKFAIEVDINLKPGIRYDKAAYYFDVAESQIGVVFWLCGNFAIAEAIFERLKKAKLYRLDVHHFFLTEDFLSLGAEAVARSGQHKQKTIKEIYLSSGYQGPAKELSRSWQGEDRQIFFGKEKSPWKKKA